MSSPYRLPLILTLFILSSGLLSSGAVACTSNIGVDGAPAAYDARVPPQPDRTAPIADGERAVFAIRSLAFGSDRPSGWKSIGLDIDHHATDRDSIDVCRRAPDVSRSVQIDGDQGIDNSFGQNLVPVIETLLGSDAMANIDARLAAGIGNDLIVVDHLPNESRASAVSGSLLHAVPFGKTPSWSGTDAWPVDADSFSDGSPRLSFNDGYIVDRTLVSAPMSGLGFFSLGAWSVSGGSGLSDLALRVPVTHVQIVARLSGDGAALTDGTLSFILPVKDVLPLAPAIFAPLGEVYCGGKSRELIERFVRESADILVDGTQDPNRDCDGISAGVGFTATRVMEGQTVPVPFRNQCTRVEIEPAPPALESRFTR